MMRSGLSPMVFFSCIMAGRKVMTAEYDPVALKPESALPLPFDAGSIPVDGSPFLCYRPENSGQLEAGQPSEPNLSCVIRSMALLWRESMFAGSRRRFSPLPFEAYSYDRDSW